MTAKKKLVKTVPTRSGAGLAIRLGDTTVAWATPGGGSLGRKYRAALNGKEPDPRVLEALDRAVAKLRKANGR